MTTVVDSDRMPARDRAEAIREMASSIVAVDLDFPAPAGPVVRGSVTDIGGMRITSIQSNATKVERTPTQARDQLTPSVMLGLQITGSSLVIQDGREVVVEPADLVVYHSTAPYTLVDMKGYRQHQIRMPVAELNLPHDLLRRISAVKLCSGHPLADLASDYFRRIAMRPNVFAGPRSEALSQPSIALIRAVIATHLEIPAVAKEAGQASLQLRVLAYVRSHLAQPDLSAAQIAAHHHISVRHLYKVLAEGDIRLGDTIRRQRLEACHRELAQPAAHQVSIAAIAHGWGFVDTSNFGRLFRATYGFTPREWREMGRHGNTPQGPTNPAVQAATADAVYCPDL